MMSHVTCRYMTNYAATQRGLGFFKARFFTLQKWGGSKHFPRIFTRRVQFLLKAMRFSRATWLKWHEHQQKLFKYPYFFKKGFKRHQFCLSWSSEFGLRFLVKPKICGCSKFLDCPDSSPNLDLLSYPKKGFKHSGTPTGIPLVGSGRPFFPVKPVEFFRFFGPSNVGTPGQHCQSHAGPISSCGLRHACVVKLAMLIFGWKEMLRSCEGWN